LSNPRDLFLQLLAEQLWTERRLSFDVLPELRKAVESEGLAAAVEEHLEQTREHGPRLEKVFRALGAEPSSNLNPPVEKLAEHHDELAGSFSNDRLEDVFHASAAATTEHHELAAYDTLLTLAGAVELPDDARGLLEQNRSEEAEALGRLQQERDRLVGQLGR
jgi:ferritin-like metal-binding protein YciE